MHSNSSPNYTYDNCIKVSSFEDFLLTNLDHLQKLFTQFSSAQTTHNLVHPGSQISECLKNTQLSKQFLEYINSHLINLILTYHSNDISFDLLTFLKDYIDELEKNATKEHAHPAKVKKEMTDWIQTIPPERYSALDAD